MNNTILLLFSLLLIAYAKGPFPNAYTMQGVETRYRPEDKSSITLPMRVAINASVGYSIVSGSDVFLVNAEAKVIAQNLFDKCYILCGKNCAACGPTAFSVLAPFNSQFDMFKPVGPCYDNFGREGARYYYKASNGLSQASLCIKGDEIYSYSVQFFDDTGALDISHYIQIDSFERSFDFNDLVVPNGCNTCLGSHGISKLFNHLK